METIMFELCRKDANYVAACIARQEADLKRDPKKKPPPAYYTLVDRVQQMYEPSLTNSALPDLRPPPLPPSLALRLDNNIPLRSGEWSIEDVNRINDIIPQAITLKPIVYLVNVDKRSWLRKGNKWYAPINEWVKTHGGGTIIPFSVEWEQELWALRYPSPLSSCRL
jgi:obg-like ATPase 1